MRSAKCTRSCLIQAHHLSWKLTAGHGVRRISYRASYCHVLVHSEEMTQPAQRNCVFAYLLWLIAGERLMWKWLTDDKWLSMKSAKDICQPHYPIKGEELAEGWVRDEEGNGQGDAAFYVFLCLSGTISLHHGVQPLPRRVSIFLSPVYVFNFHQWHVIESLV